MGKSKETEIDLDVFFQDAKEPQTELSDRLMASILADAAEVSAERHPVEVVDSSGTAKPNWLRRFLDPLGGIQGAAAVGFCTVLGVAAGYAGTDTILSVPGLSGFVDTSSEDTFNEFSYDAIAGYSDFLTEG